MLHFQSHTICLGKDSVLGRLIDRFPDVDVGRYIQFFNLRSYGFCGVIPLQENVYVHSMLMMIDDRHVMVGSANINDRSLLGVRDSEVAVYLENAPDVVAKFRRVLWSRHLGLDVDGQELNDPVSCFHDYWCKVALSNTAIFEKVWPDLPSSKHTTLSSVANCERGPLDPGNLQRVKGFVVNHPMFFLAAEENLLPSLAKKEGSLVDYSMFQ